MADHTITFSEEQNLLLDKLVREKEEAEAKVAGLEAKITKLEEDKTRLFNQAQQARRQLVEARENAPEAKAEEEIRANERERIAVFFEMRGQEPESFYESFGNGVSMNAGSLATMIRHGSHNQSYFDYRKDMDPEGWPDDYMKGPEDYEFDINIPAWERFGAE